MPITRVRFRGYLERDEQRPPIDPQKLREMIAFYTLRAAGLPLATRKRVHAERMLARFKALLPS